MLNKKALEKSRKRNSAALAGDAPKPNDRDFDYLWVKASSLTPGVVHRFRLAPPHPEKCVNGFRYYAQHYLEIKPGGTLDDGGKEKILCADVYDEPCLLCSVAQIVRDEGYVDPSTSPLKPDVIKALAGLFPQTSHMYPAIFRVKSIPVKRNGREYTNYAPDEDEPERMAVFQVTAASLQDAIEEIAGEYPTCGCTDDRGRYLRFKRPVKGWRYKLRAENEESELETDWDKLKEAYPNIDGFGEKNKRDEAAVEHILKKCWWFRHIADIIDFSDDGETEEDDIDSLLDDEDF